MASSPSARGHESHAQTEPDLEYSVLADGEAFDLRFGEVATFRACYKTRSVSLIGGLDQDQATIDHLLFDHAIPRILSACVPLVLHGSLVDMGGVLAVFVGETGAGKSTLGASLHARGFRLLGDDAVILTEQEGTFFGEAVYPSLRLYPNSIEEVMGKHVATARMAHYSDKRHVTGFGAGSEPAGPMPIGHIFLLADECPEPRVETVPLRDVCMALIEQSFALDPKDIAAAGKRMRQAGALAAAVPAKALCYPHDYTVLPKVHRLIEDTMAAVVRTR